MHFWVTDEDPRVVGRKCKPGRLAIYIDPQHVVTLLVKTGAADTDWSVASVQCKYRGPGPQS